MFVATFWCLAAFWGGKMALSNITLMIFCSRGFFIFISFDDSWILDHLESHPAKCQPQLLGNGNSKVAIVKCVCEMEFQLCSGIFYGHGHAQKIYKS